MIYFKIDNVPYEMPSTWKEIDVATFQRLAAFKKDYSDLVGLVAALVGVDREKLMNAKDHGLGRLHVDALKMVADDQPLWEQIPHRDKFKFRDEFHDVPKDMGATRYGQKIMLQQRLAENEPAVLSADRRV